MSRFRTDLRAALPKRRNPTKFPPVRTGWGNRSPPASARLRSNDWATDMVVGLQLRTVSPPKEVRTSTYSPVQREEDVISSEPSRKPTPDIMHIQQIDNLKQQAELLQQQQQQYLDRIAQLEREIEKLKSRNASQQKTIDNLKTEVKTQNNTISELEERLKVQELDYEKQREKLMVTLDTKDKRIKELEIILDSRVQEIDHMKKEFAEQKDQMEKEFDIKLQEVSANYQKELTSRDEKLKILKLHMADALKDNSRERQHQLEELTRELKRVTEETDLLRSKIHSVKPSQQIKCQNCPMIEKQLQSKIIQVRDKDLALIELQQLCSKMEKQLVQQDDLLRQWARSKGKDLR